MIERSGSIPLTNGSGFRRPKNIQIRRIRIRIRIRNTGGKPTWCQDRLRRRTSEEGGMERGIVVLDVVCVPFQVFRNVSPSFDLGCHRSCTIIDIFNSSIKFLLTIQQIWLGGGRDICSCTISVADPGCLSWISDLNFFPSRIPGPEWQKFRIPDPDPHQRI